MLLRFIFIPNYHRNYNSSPQSRNYNCSLCGQICKLLKEPEAGETDAPSGEIAEQIRQLKFQGHASTSDPDLPSKISSESSSDQKTNNTTIADLPLDDSPRLSASNDPDGINKQPSMAFPSQLSPSLISPHTSQEPNIESNSSVMSYIFQIINNSI